MGVSGYSESRYSAIKKESNKARSVFESWMKGTVYRGLPSGLVLIAVALALRDLATVPNSFQRSGTILCSSFL